MSHGIAHGVASLVDEDVFGPLVAGDDGVDLCLGAGHPDVGGVEVLHVLLEVFRGVALAVDADEDHLKPGRLFGAQAVQRRGEVAEGGGTDVGTEAVAEVDGNGFFAPEVREGDVAVGPVQGEVVVVALKGGDDVEEGHGGQKQGKDDQ